MRLSLERLIRPRSVAIVGASEKTGALGASVLANLERAGFRGAIHLVNPKRVEIGARRCVASVDDLPEGVDAAVLAIPRAAVLDAVRALARRKAGAAIIFSSGFAETGAEGLAEQRELARIAAESDMAIEGPNCLGLVNFVDGVPLTFVELPGDLLGARPGIGLVSQSGAMAAVLAVTLASRGLGLSYSISTGNEAASGVEDYVDYLVDDPDTQTIAMIVEQFRKPARFLAAATRAAAMAKPIVLLHPGRSSAAREFAATHTGALAGDHDVMRLKVERAGVLLVETLEELGDVAEMVLRLPARSAGRGRGGLRVRRLSRRSRSTSLSARVCRSPRSATRTVPPCGRRCLISCRCPTRSTSPPRASSIPISTRASSRPLSATTASAPCCSRSSRPMR